MRDWDKELEKELQAYKSWKDRFGGFSRDMTLRDYFAAKAMQSLFEGAVAEASTLDADIDYDMGARIAYKMADAMLEARKT